MQSLDMSETVVVTGAYGFLGRHVARLFSRCGYTVLGMGHGEWSREEWQQWGLSGWLCADVTLETLEQHAVVPSVIVHCAGGGSVSFSIEDPIADFERTVVSTAHVLEYVRKAAPSCRVVYPSSASVYGTVEELPIREDCRTAPISQYGVHKLMAELMVASYARQFGTSATIVRLFLSIWMRSTQTVIVGRLPQILDPRQRFYGHGRRGTGLVACRGCGRAFAGGG